MKEAQRMNSIIIHGRLAKSPELKEIQGKKGMLSVCNFVVATDRSFGEETDFFDCKIFGKRAEVINKFFHKGSEIVVRGEMQRRKYQNKDGENRYVWECLVGDFDFCGSKKDSGSNQTTGNEDIPDGFEPINDEDIPF